MMRVPRLSGPGCVWLLLGLAAYGALVFWLRSPPGIIGGVRYFGVPTDAPTFNDLFNIVTAIECDALGHDVLLENPCDPMRRPMNYPRLWLGLRRLGLRRDTLNLFGALFALGFFAAAVWLLRRIAHRDVPWALAFLLSPAAMLLVERGNNDAVVFCCLVGAAAARGRPSERWWWLGLLAVLLGGILKLYPIVAILATLRRGQGRWVAAGAGALALFGLYAWSIRDQIAKISQVTPRESYWSYGFGVVPHQMSAQLARMQVPVSEGGARVLAWLLAAGVAILGVRWAHRLRPQIPAAVSERPGEERVAFVCGASIYCTTFLFGSNWDYRLAMLLLCFPLTNAFRARREMRRFAMLFLASAIAAVWLGFFHPVVQVFSLQLQFDPLLDGLASWILLLCAWTGLWLCLDPRQSAREGDRAA